MNHHEHLTQATKVTLSGATTWIATAAAWSEQLSPIFDLIAAGVAIIAGVTTIIWTVGKIRNDRGGNDDEGNPSDDSSAR